MRTLSFHGSTELSLLSRSYPVDYNEKQRFWEFSWECIRQRRSVCSFEFEPHPHNQLEIQLYFLTNTTTKGSKRFNFPCFCWELVIQVFIRRIRRWHCKWVCQRSMVPLNLWSFPDVMVQVDAPFPCRCLPCDRETADVRTWWDDMERGGNKWVEAKQFEEWPYIAILYI